MTQFFSFSHPGFGKFSISMALNFDFRRQKSFLISLWLALLAPFVRFMMGGDFAK
jgi:hypothetical protein